MSWRARRTLQILPLWLGMLAFLLICFIRFKANNAGNDASSLAVKDAIHNDPDNSHNGFYSSLLKKLQEVMHNSSHPKRFGFDDFELIVHLSSILPKIDNITRIPTPSSEIFLNYIAPVGLPVIFTDMLVGTSFNEWTWDKVKRSWGNQVFHNTRQGTYQNKVNKFGKLGINRISVQLSDFIDIVNGLKEPSEHEKGMYITKQKLPFNAIEFYYPPFYPSNNKRCFLEPTGWIGASGTYTQGHIDSKDNFVYQLIGQKRWTVYSPVDYKYLYYTKNKKKLEWSRVLTSPHKPDLTVYPLYAMTHPVQFVMKPGEVLYLPRGWTHFVENLTPSLMVNTWRRGPAAIIENMNGHHKEAVKKNCF